MGALAFGALVFGGLFALRFCGTEPLPPLPPAPEVSVADGVRLSKALGQTEENYRNTVVQDSRALGLEPPSLEEMSAVFPHSADRSEKVLEPGDTVSTVGLELSLAVQDIGPVKRQMVLTIRNKTDRHVAYQVITQPSVGTAPCSRKEVVRHNAVALPPRGSVSRSECIYRPGWTLGVSRVETVALPELGFHYISRMPPAQLGLETRVAAGHDPPEGDSICGVVLPVRVVAARERGEIGWRDLVDFYARHSCERFRFPRNFRAFERDGASALPVPGSSR